MDHLRGNKDIRKDRERNPQRLRKTRTITDHDGRRTRGVRRPDRRENTRIKISVAGGT
jgi:hypothetical protein